MIAQARAEVVAETRDALDGTDVTVTDDPHEAASAIAYGGTVVLVHASPSIEWQNPRWLSLTWTLWIITGTSTTPAAASDELQDVLVRAAALAPDRAEPNTYEIGDRTFLGYDLTLTTEIST